MEEEVDKFYLTRRLVNENELMHNRSYRSQGRGWGVLILMAALTETELAAVDFIYFLHS